MTDQNAAAAASARVPLTDGLGLPLLGLGVWQAREGEQTSRAVGGLDAVAAGAIEAPAVNQVQFSRYSRRERL
jgi:hypothetical protein